MRLRIKRRRRRRKRKERETERKKVRGREGGKKKGSKERIKCNPPKKKHKKTMHAKLTIDLRLSAVQTTDESECLRMQWFLERNPGKEEGRGNDSVLPSSLAVQRRRMERQ